MQDPFGSIAPVLATVTIGFVYFINITSIYCIYFTNAVIFGYYILSLAMDVTNESAIKNFLNSQSPSVSSADPLFAELAIQPFPQFFLKTHFLQAGLKSLHNIEMIYKFLKFLRSKYLMQGLPIYIS